MEPLSIALGLARFVPEVIGYFAGDKAEDAAKDVIKIAERVTGKAGPDAEKAIAENPELALKFKIAVLDNKVEMDRMYLADRQDARKRDVELRKLGSRNTRPDVMLICASIILCLSIWMVANLGLEGEVLAIFHMMIGALIKMLGDAFQFEFGSSRGSKEKDLLLKGR